MPPRTFIKSFNTLRLEEFHRVFVPKELGLQKIREVRARLLEEEHRELQEALDCNNREQIAKELADLVYVCYGTALVYNIDLDIACHIVHESNMSKLDDDGRPILREDGKVLKGPNYKPPDMEPALK
jgi:predicted HAD superfamily Cof-like phosphohydrolase